MQLNLILVYGFKIDRHDFEHDYIYTFFKKQFDQDFWNKHVIKKDSVFIGLVVEECVTIKECISHTFDELECKIAEFKNEIVEFLKSDDGEYMFSYLNNIEPKLYIIIDDN